MIKVIFKDLEKSELAKETAVLRMSDVIERFPHLESCRITITLSMQNSPTQAGPDLFTVKFHCESGKYKGLILSKSAPTLYIALAELSDCLLERLNRFGDKQRVKKVKQARSVRKRLFDLELSITKDTVP